MILDLLSDKDVSATAETYQLRYHLSPVIMWCSFGSVCVLLSETRFKAKIF